MSEPTTASSARKGAKARRTKSPKALASAVGTDLRIDLLPSEVRTQRAGARNVRRAWVAVVAVAVIMVGGSAGSLFYAAGVSTELVAAQANTQQLALQQVKYAKVRQIQNRSKLISAARIVGASTEIDWNDYLQRIRATLPSGVTMTAVKIDSATPFAAYQQADSPLQGPRVATLVFTADSTTLPSVPDWLDALEKLPGFVDATPDSVAMTDGTFTTQVTMHINEKAWDKRFQDSKTEG